MQFNTENLARFIACQEAIEGNIEGNYRKVSFTYSNTSLSTCKTIYDNSKVVNSFQGDFVQNQKVLSTAKVGDVVIGTIASASTGYPTSIETFTCTLQDSGVFFVDWKETY
jgi:poly-beta-hydroxyalkanoate depolymerase